MIIERQKPLNILYFLSEISSCIMFHVSEISTQVHANNYHVFTMWLSYPKSIHAPEKMYKWWITEPNWLLNSWCIQEDHNDTFAGSIDMLLTQSHINWRYLLMFGTLTVLDTLEPKRNIKSSYFMHKDHTPFIRTFICLFHYKCDTYYTRIEAWL
jgi:hypothetical protein